MVDNQHKKISGHRYLTKAEIALMNEIKALEKDAADLLLRVLTAGGDDISVLSARRKLTEGFMWAVRSVVKPDSPWADVLPLHLTDS